MIPHRHRSLAAALLLLPCLANAQERMEVLAFNGRNVSMAEIDVGVSRFGTVRQMTPVDVEWAAGPGTVYAVAGGRYLVWNMPQKYPHEPGGYEIFDRRTRSMTHLPGQSSGLLADPFRPRMFLLTSNAVSVFDFRTGVLRTVATSTTSEWNVLAAAYAGRADRLALLESRSNGTTTERVMRVVDVATGSVHTTFPLPGVSPLSSPPMLEAAADGSRLFLTEVGAGPVVAYDAATGAELARSADFGAHLLKLVMDEEHQRLYVQEFSVGRLAALDAATLATLAQFTVGGGGEDTFHVIPGRDNTGAYLLRGQTGTGGNCVAVDLEALDLFGQRRATVRLSDLLGGAAPRCAAPFAGAVVLRNPKAPADLVAQVTGGTVSLSWQNPGDTVDFELEVGLAPGATDLRLPVGDTTAFGAAGVAPGAYYVRVRARNEVGASQPSREVRVEVR